MQACISTGWGTLAAIPEAAATHQVELWRLMQLSLPVLLPPPAKLLQGLEGQAGDGAPRDGRQTEQGPGREWLRERGGQVRDGS